MTSRVLLAGPGSVPSRACARRRDANRLTGWRHGCCGKASHLLFPSPRCGSAALFRSARLASRRCRFATRDAAFRRTRRDRGRTARFSCGIGAAELRELEASLKTPNVGWIATTRRGQMEDDAVRRLVRDYCFDYVTVPYECDRIVESVGHAYGMVTLSEGLAPRPRRCATKARWSAPARRCSRSSR